MRFFGFEVRRTKASPVMMSSVSDNRGGWFPWIREPYTGAWQRNDEWSVDTVLEFPALFACMTLIASDMGKLRPKLMVQDESSKIWEETESAAFSPVLRKPNRYQNYNQFKEHWALSKLSRGNTYVLQVRNQRGNVVQQYILDPSRVSVLVAPDGQVFYQLGQDNLTGVEETSVTVPASEIIHDRFNCLFHPLVGLSPIFACGMASSMGLKIQENAKKFFENGSNPGGILMVPTAIPQEKADQLQQKWQQNYTGENAGKVAVLTDGLKFEALRMSSVDAQMIEHLKWTAEMVCSAFHVPPFKIGLGQMPTYQNGETLNQIYYTDCLQAHIEAFELCMDEGLGLDEKKESGRLGVELDLDGLFRMDSATQMKTLGEGVQRSIYAPNEARRKVDLPPVPGGEHPLAQQQNFSLATLAKRPPPADTAPQGSAQTPPAPESEESASLDDVQRHFDARTKAFIYPRAEAA